jgi:hypothetical protein
MKKQIVTGQDSNIPRICRGYPGFDNAEEPVLFAPDGTRLHRAVALPDGVDCLDRIFVFLEYCG